MAQNARGYSLVISPRFQKVLKSLKRKQQSLFRELVKSMEKLTREPEYGKPLRNVLRNYRRIHIGSHVLIYEIFQDEIRLIDFDHHDRIYKQHG